MKRKSKTQPKKRQMRGFALMSLTQRQMIAALGGIAVSRGPKGRARMAALGAIGGKAKHKLAAK